MFYLEEALVGSEASLFVSQGSAHRIHGLIRKDAIEHLLNAFVSAACDCSPNYSILVPLLNMLAKVGHKGNNRIIMNEYTRCH